MTAAPYPADTRAKGWRFEIDVERIEQSDTWTLAPSAIRPWLLMLWMTAWKQTPCGTLTDDDTLIAARIGMSLKEFTKHRAILMRGWWIADDGRLYHAALTERVEAMLVKREKDAGRTAARRARTAGAATSPPEVTDMSRVTPTGLTGEFDTKHQAPSTRNQAPAKETVPVGTGGAGAPPQASELIFGLGVPLLTAANVAERNARSMLGLMRKTHGDGAVLEAIQRCAEQRPLEPVAWLQGALKQRALPPQRRGGSATDADLAALNAASDAEARHRLFGAETEIIDA